jgi:DNA-binding NtrC family response regulator
MVHDLSPRGDGPFLAVNCAAIPAPLIEAELFGHERGAFTGARERRPGLVEMASGGTLLLDEVADLPLELQGKFLRVLAERRVRRLGAHSETDVDLRVLAATNRDLRAEVAAGRFREDLYFRLAVFTVDVPPLSERLDDVPVLARHFAGRLAAEAGRPVPEFGAAALQRLREHSWPGNVRELRNVVERALILGDGKLVREGDLPPEIARRPDGEGIRMALGRRLEEVERDYLLATLRRLGGNRSRTAEALGVSQKTLYNKLRRYALDDDRP